MEQALDWARRFLLPGYVVEARCLLTWAGGDRVACAARGFSRAIFLRRADAGTKKIATALILVGEPVGLDKNGPPVSRTDGPHNGGENTTCKAYPTWALASRRAAVNFPPVSGRGHGCTWRSSGALPAENLWSECLAARDRAERSRDLADGRAAGRAWAQFLSAFVR
jgi:hypothetical protein